MSNLFEQLAGIRDEAIGSAPSVKDPEDLKLYKAKFLGKSGLVTGLLKMLGGLSSEERPNAGKQINDLKNEVLKLIEDVEIRLSSAGLNRSLAQKFDITLPGRDYYDSGSLHPVMQILKKIEEIFLGLGFSIHEGPEVETDRRNFEALNVPADHPARDMQDTFYINGKCQMANDKCRGSGSDLLLRTHTSPVQIHVMEKFKPPIRMIFPGAVYRRDADITHSPMFHQVEGLMVGEKGSVTMADLKGLLTEFLHQVFGHERGVRFRPSFFPFTEPSAEVDMQCVICDGKKTVAGNPCRVCKQTGWMEILGCGMVDPNVFKAVGYDPAKVSGFAFGMGVERIAMLKYGVSDIRAFFENDLRFLKQF